eukprot:164663-Rhodomonas_salina.4
MQPTARSVPGVAHRMWRTIREAASSIALHSLKPYESSGRQSIPDSRRNALGRGRSIVLSDIAVIPCQHFAQRTHCRHMAD